MEFIIKKDLKVNKVLLNIEKYDRSDCKNRLKGIAFPSMETRMIFNRVYSQLNVEKFAFVRKGLGVFIKIIVHSIILIKGMDFRIFENNKEALEWLKEKNRRPRPH